MDTQAATQELTLPTRSSVRRAPAHPFGRRVLHGSARVLLAVYIAALAAIAFWPQRVDAAADGMLADVTLRLPWLTYDLIEFSANIILFMPFGMLLAWSLRGRVLPAIVVVVLASASIEVAQGLFLAERTASLLDVVANVSGGVVGAVVAGLMVRRRR